MEIEDSNIPPYGRLIATGLLFASLIGLLLNHWMAETQTIGRLLILCFAPLGVFVGLGGIVEPKIIWSVGKYGQHLPLKYKVIGGSLAAAGVVVTLMLVFLVYPSAVGMRD